MKLNEDLQEPESNEEVKGFKIIEKIDETHSDQVALVLESGAAEIESSEISLKSDLSEKCKKEASCYYLI